MLDASFITAVAELGRHSQSTKVVKDTPEPDGYYYVSTPSGELKLITSQPPDRNHTAFDLTAVVAFAKRFAGESDEHGPAVVWYSRNGVYCRLDDNDGRAKVSLKLQMSPQIQILQSWERQQHDLPQAKAVLALRSLFDGCLDNHPSIISVIRKLKFSTLAQGEGAIEHGRSSIGKSLEATITGEGAIPEFVTFNVPIFAGVFDYRGDVRCALEPNAGQNSLAFIPLPGQIEKAVAAAEGSISDMLRMQLEDACPVYFGEP